MMINIHQSQSLPLTQIGKRKLRSYLVTKMLMLMQKLKNDIEPEINPDTSFIGCELDIELEPISVPNPDTLFIGCEPDIEPEINSVPLTLDPDIPDTFMPPIKQKVQFASSSQNHPHLYSASPSNHEA